MEKGSKEREAKCLFWFMLRWGKYRYMPAISVFTGVY